MPTVMSRASAANCLNVPQLLQPLKAAVSVLELSHSIYPNRPLGTSARRKTHMGQLTIEFLNPFPTTPGLRMPRGGEK